MPSPTPPSRSPSAFRDSLSRLSHLSHIGSWCDTLPQSHHAPYPSSLHIEESPPNHSGCSQPHQQDPALNQRHRTPPTNPGHPPLQPSEPTPRQARQGHSTAAAPHLNPMRRWLSETTADEPWRAIDTTYNPLFSNNISVSSADYSVAFSDTHATRGGPSSSKGSDGSQPRDGG
ncbi:hypothetical protein K432DRAFT_387315 [Lepidopterella palustris CBS 459.81]|uniref:Uncharacterized protein n=1 Tax=Lepidopterella palustris CBS 459.81 TaxID=1314670 RepID=A0A8E2J8T7_9PEZI|nr:hypothetical protein K432DRAFT_387315 [Lepidopterella palustris CBS 459.81]